jgi:hypothetical protein
MNSKDLSVKFFILVQERKNRWGKKDAHPKNIG